MPLAYFTTITIKWICSPVDLRSMLIRYLRGTELQNLIDLHVSLCTGNRDWYDRCYCATFLSQFLDCPNQEFGLKILNVLVS